MALYKQVEGGSQPGLLIKGQDCDICGVVDQEALYDAYLPGLGWGWACTKCFQRHKGKLGVGRGQMYERVVPVRIIRGV